MHQEAEESIRKVETDDELQGYLLPYHWFLPKESIWTSIHDAYVSRVVRLVVESGAKRVLEVGCGDGWNCGQLVKAGLEVTGIDWSANGIDHARRLVPQGSFFCGDLIDSDFKAQFPEPFDAVILVEVLEHIPPEECALALRNITASLKPGGSFVLTTPSVNFPNTNPRHFRHFTPAMLEDLAQHAGELRVKHIEGYGDMRHLKVYEQLLPLVNNRLYSIKPLRRRLQNYVRQRAERTTIDRCCGLIAVMEKKS
ncbi:MAG TPA: class I SAM-dependent methyltransferase [Tepidisphaeraceae bacterium]|nr:class I SAM-dependent methyltransferase [Tepidisphaeraceae bacterium]